MDSALSHSKTWPVKPSSMVELRMDSSGKAYSTFMGNVLDVLVDKNSTNDNINNGKVICEKLLSTITGRSYRAVRTDTVSTVVDQELENDLEAVHDQERYILEDNPNKAPSNPDKYDTFHVLALAAKMDERSAIDLSNICRRPSIKIENWDLVYTEASKAKCPIHGALATMNACSCKAMKTTTPCMDHTEYMLPELPLDARKVTTLRRHYYPEGGWGWVIVICSVLVHVLNHGIQLSCPEMVMPAAEKFNTLHVHVAGGYRERYRAPSVRRKPNFSRRK